MEAEELERQLDAEAEPLYRRGTLVQAGWNDFELVKPGRELLKEKVLVNLAIREVPQPWEVLLVTDALLFAYIKVHILLKCEVNTISSGRLQWH